MARPYRDAPSVLYLFDGTTRKQLRGAFRAAIGYLPRMTAIDFVDVATARDAPGVRIVVSGLVPSPWSEATKGLFRIADVPVLAVRRGRDAAEITAWTGIDNVPVVFHAAEP